MATSSCPKCAGHIFEAKPAEPKNSNYQLMFVQCASCGAVVGVLEANNVGQQIGLQNEAIKRIAQAVGTSVDL